MFDQTIVILGAIAETVRSSESNDYSFQARAAFKAAVAIETARGFKTSLARELRLLSDTLTPTSLLSSGISPFNDYRNKIIMRIEAAIVGLRCYEPETGISREVENIKGIQRGRDKSKVFIVHGHNEEMKLAVAKFIRELKLEPVILSEKPNKGLTIIEKFESHSNVGFAIGLISPDDWWRKAYSRTKEIKRCPRQNVILETGFFIGLLGRENVSLLVKHRDKLVYPSDYDGMLFNSYDETGEWKKNLALELHHAGFKIDPKFLPPQ